MSEQGISLRELLRDMQQEADNMTAMLQDMCRALDIDETSLSDSIKDGESSIAVSDTSSHTLSDMEIGDIDSDASHSV